MARHVLAVLLAILTAATGALLASDQAICPADLEALFQVAEHESQGVWVTDRAAVIGGLVADEKFHSRLLNAFMPLPGWYPVDGTKRVVCGTLEYWNLFNGPSPELDLHAFIHPSLSFRPILDELPPFGTQHAGHDHVWGEVTPPDWFADFWQVKNVPPSGGDNACGADRPGEPPHACRATMWADRTACMYGPWVMERYYKYRVEIHPAQMLWGRDGDVLRLFVLSDTSQRFEDRRKYRRLKAVEKWAAWSAPVSPTVWIAVGATAPRTLAVSVTRGPLSQAPPSTPSDTTIDLSGVSVRVSHPGSLQIGRGPACRLPNGEMRGFVAVSAGNAPLDALDITGDVLGGTTPSAPTPSPSSSSTTAAPVESENNAELNAPIFDLRHIEWDPPMTLQPGLEYSRTKADWGYVPANTVAWTAAAKQRLHLAVTMKNGAAPPPGSRFSVDWTIEACDVEASAAGCAPVRLGSNQNDMLVEIRRGSQMAMTVPDGVSNKKTDTPNELLVWVRYPVTQPFGGGRRATSVRLRLSATLRDAQGRTAAFTHVLRNLAPDYAAAIQPYNVEKKGGAIPDALIDFAVGWLRQQGLTMTSQQLQQDWNLTVAQVGEVIGPLDVQARRRLARVLRLGLLTFLEDETIDAEELRDVLEMLNNYAAAIWASAPPP